MKFPTLIGLIALLNINSVYSQCSRTYVRKEIRQLSSGEINAFFSAVKKLHSGSSPTKYDQFVGTHLQYTPEAHGVPAFLTWHRYYLRQFEIALQAIDPSVTVPYWNWAYDSQAPELAGVFTSSYFGSGGSGGCLNDGQFANWRVYYDESGSGNPHCLQRKFNLAGSKIGAFYSPEALQQIISGSTSYDQFHQQLEYAPHASVHNGIGGDMSSMASPNDPIFWLHHAFIDKLYFDWQTSKSRNLNDYGGTNPNGRQATLNDILNPFKVKVSQAINAANLCYTYSQDGIDVTKPPPVTNTTATVTPPTPTPTPSSSNSRSNTRSSSSSNSASNSRSRSRSNNDHSSSTKTSSNNDDDDSTPTPTNTKHTVSTGKPIDYYTTSVKIDISIGTGVQVQPTAPVVAPPSDDRADDSKLRLPLPIPDYWTNMNKLSITIMKQQEIKLSKVITTYNKLPNYKSPVCLSNRPDLASHIKGKKIRKGKNPILKPLPNAHPDYVPSNNNNYEGDNSSNNGNDNNNGNYNNGNNSSNGNYNNGNNNNNGNYNHGNNGSNGNYNHGNNGNNGNYNHGNNSNGNGNYNHGNNSNNDNYNHGNSNNGNGNYNNGNNGNHSHGDYNNGNTGSNYSRSATKVINPCPTEVDQNNNGYLVDYIQTKLSKGKQQVKPTSKVSYKY